jgi:putative membrane protein
MLDPGSSAAAAEKKAEGDKKLSSGEEKFIKDAAMGGMAEVELGKIAAEKATNSQVKEFGQRMQKDHGKANDELKKLASDKAVELPKELEGKHKSTVERLSKLAGNEFDREYMRVMVDDHKETVDKFQREAKSGKDADVKNFASKSLPTLKEHLALAQTTRQQVRGAKKGTEAAKKANGGAKKAER